VAGSSTVMMSADHGAIRAHIPLLTIDAFAAHPQLIQHAAPRCESGLARSVESRPLTSDDAGCTPSSSCRNTQAVHATGNPSWSAT